MQTGLIILVTICVIASVVVIESFVSRKKLRSEIARLRGTQPFDPATGLMTTRGLHARLEAEIQRSRRREVPLRCYSIDVLKGDADSFGTALMEACIFPTAAFRASATRFILLVPQREVPEWDAGDHWLAVIAERVFVNVGVGAAQYPDDAETSVDLLAVAHSAAVRGGGSWS